MKTYIPTISILLLALSGPSHALLAADAAAKSADTNYRDNGQVRCTGRIALPGVFKIEPGTPMSEVARRFGGVTSEANASAVRITRSSEDGKLVVHTIDLNSKAGGEFKVQPGDIVYVPAKG